MIHGPSGLLAAHPPGERPVFKPSQRQLLWRNGAQAMVFSGDYPEQLRGPQFDAAWIDEIAKFKEPQKLWDTLNMGLRLGPDPRAIVTTTPRPILFIEQMLRKASEKNSDVVVTRGTTFDNAANLSARFINALKETYGSTGLAQQELYGQIIHRNSHSLWTQERIDRYRVRHIPPLERIVVAVDPAVTHTQRSDETGIIVAGRCAQGNGYVLADHSGVMSPLSWAQVVCDLYDHYQADRIIVEANQGGELTQQMLQQVKPHVPITPVWATRSKKTRAEPVAALYEKGLIFHPYEGLQSLEAQMCSVCQRRQHSPDRVDALVWALTFLFLGTNHIKIWHT